MTYGYKVSQGKVYVTPVVYVCMACGLETTNREEEAYHYYVTGHFSKSTQPAERTEEWDKAKHGALPDWVESQLTQEGGDGHG